MFIGKIKIRSLGINIRIMNILNRLFLMLTGKDLGILLVLMRVEKVQQMVQILQI